jgi:FMN phosphatase YigB (HAD superfamily)
MRFDAIVFDLGNTLVPWGDAESAALLGAMRVPLERARGPIPDLPERTLRARDSLEARPTLREVTTAEFVEAVTGRAPAPPLVDAVDAAVHEAFPRIARVPDWVPALLDRLGRRRPLAVLSNFFLTAPVERLLRETGLFERFVHVEVSATGGYRKPHPAPFDAVRERLGTPMERTLMVGDDFWADVVGGHRAGFLTALTHEHRQDRTSDPRAPGVRADRVLSTLRELEG